MTEEKHKPIEDEVKKPATPEDDIDPPVKLPPPPPVNNG